MTLEEMVEKGTGFVVMDVIMTTSILLACSLNFAVIKDKTIKELDLATSFRWLMVTAWGGLGIVYSVDLIRNGDIIIPLTRVIFHSILAIGCIGLAGMQLCDRRKRRTMRLSRAAEILEKTKQAERRQNNRRKTDNQRFDDDTEANMEG